MAIQSKPQDPTEAALSAIEEALNLSSTDNAMPPAAETKAPEAPRKPLLIPRTSPPVLGRRATPERAP